MQGLNGSSLKTGTIVRWVIIRLLDGEPEILVNGIMPRMEEVVEAIEKHPQKLSIVRGWNLSPDKTALKFTSYPLQGVIQ